MVFLKRSTTVLLAFFALSLASNVYTAKAHAQEFKANTQCPMAQFIVIGNSSCTKPKKITPTAEFLPTTNLIPPVKLEEKKEEKKPTPPTPLVTPAVSVIETNTATLSADLLFSLTNTHRAEIGLPAFEHDVQVCSVADSRKYEMVDEIFSTHNLHAGFYAKNLPYWATENLIWQHTEKEALNWWLNSPIHRSAIEGNYKYACGVCNGEVCNMVFTNYEPKIAEVPAAVNTSEEKNSPQDNTKNTPVKKNITMTLLK